MVAIVPGFTYRQLSINYSLQNWVSSMGLVLHVAIGGDTSLYPWFSNPKAEASSHWWAGRSGGREQYLDPLKHRSWAQAAGNDEFHSVETSGNPDEALSTKQIEAVAAIYAWGHTQFGWPFKLAEYPSQRGLGWHGMGGSAWGGHTGCPGDLRKAQRPEILRAAESIINGGGSGPLPPQGEEMPPRNIKEGRSPLNKAIPARTWTGLPICKGSDLFGWDENGLLYITGQVAFSVNLPKGEYCRARFYASDTANQRVYTWPDTGVETIYEQARQITTKLWGQHQLGFEIFASVPVTVAWTNLELLVWDA